MKSPHRTKTMFLLFVLLFAQQAAALTPLGIPSGPSGRAPSFMTAVQLSTGNRWHYFSSGALMMFNALLDVNGDGAPDLGNWLYPSQSPVALNMGTTHGSDPNSTLAPGTVLAYGVAPNTYFNPRDGQRYLAVMYFTYQKSVENGAIAGRICLSFSNDGGTWTRPITAVVAGTGKTWSDCAAAAPQNSTYTEAVSAYHRTADEIHVVWIEGDIALIQSAVGSGRTMTYYATASRNAPHVLSFIGEVSRLGLYSPSVAGEPAYNFLPNLDFSYHAESQTTVLSRAYPFPSDIDGSVRCDWGTCPRGIAQLPNRVQLYCMKTYGNDQSITSNYWALEFDIGQDDGWNTIQGGLCKPTPRNSLWKQKDVDLDFDNLAQVKNADGTLWTRNGISEFYGNGLFDRQAACLGQSSGASQFYIYTSTLEGCRHLF